MKVLLSLLIMGTAVTLIGNATFAAREISSGNKFGAGTLDLKVKDQDEYFYGDGVTATWTISNMKPGDEISGWVRLRNDGSIIPNYVDISIGNMIIDPLGPESDTEENTKDMDREMIITQMDYTYYTGTVHANCLELLADTNGDGKISLDELEAQGIQNLLPPPDKKKFYTLYMTFADNDYQGDGLITTFFAICFSRLMAPRPAILEQTTHVETARPHIPNC